MALKKCKDCGNDVSSDATSCPNCGKPIKKNVGCLGILLAGLVLWGTCSFVSQFTMPGGANSSNKPASGIVLPSLGKQVVTWDEYQQIQNGMSYSRVVQIIGTPGEETSRNKIDGIPGVMESVETVMYQWVNSNGSNMNAIFQNDGLKSKAQFGLK